MKIAEDAKIDAPREAVEWSKGVYEAVDGTDETEFADAFAEDGRLKWANQDLIEGGKEIENFIGEFFQSIDTLDHTFIGIWSVEDIEGADDILTLEAKVTYTRHDGSTMTVPATTIVERQGDEAQAARIYVDVSSLYE